MADTGRASTALTRRKPEPRTHWFTWRHLRCKLVESPDAIHRGQTMLELHLIAARDTPCPLTSTGYRCCFLDTEELANANGAVAYMTAWLDREARTKTYRKTEYRWRQGDLLDLLQITDEEREP